MSLRATLPANSEARRRIVSLARSVQMDPLPKAKAWHRQVSLTHSRQVQEMPTLSVLIPHYSETIRYSKEDLFADGVPRSQDGATRISSTQRQRSLDLQYRTRAD